MSETDMAFGAASLLLTTGGIGSKLLNLMRASAEYNGAKAVYDRALQASIQRTPEQIEKNRLRDEAIDTIRRENNRQLRLIKEDYGLT